ncbi:zinc finger protein 558-like [Protopterus annectens]|uniref:zinc finger protein 558-like n=1 Tax=Protopterus annectens TaxID=7888 RepID=UPI001CFBBFAB|nr:zinc finger protein 558-like [Protopterus annectens]
MKVEVPESFEDVAVEFSEEEWAMLNKQEKALHKEVMVQNFDNMISIGCHIPVEHLWKFIRKDETILPNDTKERLMVEKNQRPGNIIVSKYMTKCYIVSKYMTKCYIVPTCM